MKTLRKWFAANLAIFGTKCKHLTPTENIFKIVENFTKFWIMSAGCFSNVFMFFWHFFVERRTFSNFKQEASFENFQRKVMLPLAIHLKATRHYFWTWNKFMQIFSKIKNATRLDVYTVQKQCLYLNVFTKRSINFIPIFLFSSSKIKYTKYKILDWFAALKKSPRWSWAYLISPAILNDCYMRLKWFDDNFQFSLNK